MKLIHLTSTECGKNIMESGFLLSEKMKRYNKKPIDSSVDEILHRFRGNSRLGKEHLLRNKAHYFMFEYDRWTACWNDVQMQFEVDVRDLDRRKLFVASTQIPEMIYAEVKGKKRTEEIELLCMHYWNDLFPFDFYIQNRRMINRVYHELWGLPFVSEVLYYGDIPMKKVTEASVYPGKWGKPLVPVYEKWGKSISASWFEKPNGVHGLKHTRNVLYLSGILADLQRLDNREKNVIAVAAIFHDIGRVNDSVDIHHGFESWKKLQGLSCFSQIKEYFTEEELRELERLICYHCIADSKYPSKDHRMLDCLKDADALDRVRFGGLDPDYLRLDSSQVLEVLARLINQ